MFRNVIIMLCSYILHFSLWLCAVLTSSCLVLSKDSQQLGWSNIGKLWVLHNVMILGLATLPQMTDDAECIAANNKDKMKAEWNLCMGWCSDILSAFFALLYTRYFSNNRSLLFLAGNVKFPHQNVLPRPSTRYHTVSQSAMIAAGTSLFANQ